MRAAYLRKETPCTSPETLTSLARDFRQTVSWENADRYDPDVSIYSTRDA